MMIPDSGFCQESIMDMQKFADLAGYGRFVKLLTTIMRHPKLVCRFDKNGKCLLRVFRLYTKKRRVKGDRKKRMLPESPLV